MKRLIIFAACWTMIAGTQTFAAPATSTAANDNWPQFRGPDGQGHVTAASLPQTLSADKNVIWRTELPGVGWSSPVIWGEQVWMTAASADGLSLRALCVDKTSGKLLQDIEVFKRTAPFKIIKANSYATPTPAVEEGRLYVSYGNGGVACLATNTGQSLWRTEEYQVNYAEGPVSSLVLYQNLLFVTCDGRDEQFVAALDKNTGKQVWKAPRAFKGKAHSTPLVVQVGGRDQLISSSANFVYGYEPLTGKEIWRVAYTGFNATPRPTAGNGLVFISTGHSSWELWGIRPDGKGDVTATNVVWKQPKNMPQNPSPILVGTELYVVSDSGSLTCLDARNGQVLWEERLKGKHGASPVAVGNILYFCSDDGKISVVQAGPAFKQLGSLDLKETIKASPAVSGNALFVRTANALYRIGEKK